MRQLQVRAIWTPVFAKHVCPELYQSDACVLYGGEGATMQHMLWGCGQQPRQETTNTDEVTVLPPRIECAIMSADCGLQKMAVQLALAAIESQRPKPTPPSPARGVRGNRQ